MSDFFEEKSNSQRHFRESINKFLLQSPSVALSQQFDLSMITSILSSTKLQIVQKDRVNLDKLYQLMKQQQSGYQLNHSDFQLIFGPQKSMKISDLTNLLKDLSLDSFDLKSELKHLCFQDKKFKFQKYDKLMKELGYNILNTKNKEIATDCFDFNMNKTIDESDIDALILLLTDNSMNKSEDE